LYFNIGHDTYSIDAHHIYIFTIWALKLVILLTTKAKK
jgi:hypothetical protein